MLLAQLFDRQDKWAEAKVELEAAMVLDPQNPQLLNFLGYSLLERRQEIKRGFELVSRAHTLVPDSPEIADSLGWGYFLANDVENDIWATPIGTPDARLMPAMHGARLPYRQRTRWLSDWSRSLRSASPPATPPPDAHRFRDCLRQDQPRAACSKAAG
jgi:hypothetical protein